MPRKFPIEFRDDVVRVARERGDTSLTQIAKDFGISQGCLHRWLKLADNQTPNTSKETTQLKKLKKRNNVLEQENEILRRAAAFFAKDLSPK